MVLDFGHNQNTLQKVLFKTLQVPFLVHLRVLLLRENQQQFDKYAMSKGVELWLLSSLNFACYNKTL
jgi:hypothetical protein